MMKSQKALLKNMVEQAESSFNRFDCENYPNRWLTAHQVMLKFASMVLNFIPYQTVQYFKDVDDCVPGNPDASEKFIKCSKEYIRVFKVWLDSQPEVSYV